MKDLLTRRNVLIGTGSAVVLAGGAYEASRLLGAQHGPSSYDDLLAKLDDRDDGTLVGKAVLVDDNVFNAKAAAGTLRIRLQHTTITQAAADDAAAGRLLEAQGWVLPETVALLCALAAKAA